jgi:hypothetical protein
MEEIRNRLDSDIPEEELEKYVVPLSTGRRGKPDQANQAGGAA